MSFLSNYSFSEEINLNDSIEFLRNSSPIQKQDLKPNLDGPTDLSSDERNSSALSSKYFLINFKNVYS